MAVTASFPQDNFTVQTAFFGTETGGFGINFVGAEVARKNLAMLKGQFGATRATHVRVDAGAAVAKVGAANERVEADAAILAEVGHNLTMLVADCVPIVIFSTRRPLLAALHGGRRNLDVGVIGNTVRAMQAEPAELAAYLGPGIKQASYKLPRQKIIDETTSDWMPFCKPAGDDVWVDIYAFARHELQKLGITAITEDPTDTGASTGF